MSETAHRGQSASRRTTHIIISACIVVCQTLVSIKYCERCCRSRTRNAIPGRRRPSVWCVESASPTISFLFLTFFGIKYILFARNYLVLPFVLVSTNQCSSKQSESLCTWAQRPISSEISTVLFILWSFALQFRSKWKEPLMPESPHISRTMYLYMYGHLINDFSSISFSCGFMPKTWEYDVKNMNPA